MIQHTDDLPIDANTPVVQPVPTGVMAKEPALAVGGSISLLLLAAFNVLRVSGLNITDEMSDAIIGFVNALCLIPAFAGFITRFFVFSPASTQKESNLAAVTGIAPEVK